jgi:predicted tellurium resistance membrane protein TerC
MDWLVDPQIWIALLTLTALEIVLGIDNIIFISILAGKLPKDQQAKGRFYGLGFAMVTRVLLLLSLTAIMRLTQPLFTFIQEISGRDLILIIGGLFLIAKSTFEIHEKLEGIEEEHEVRSKGKFWGVIFQIGLLDIVFSLDSVITAVGMANNVGVMIAAVMIAVVFMMFASGTISDFVNRHPTVKILALSFLILIGVSLVAEGLEQHISKGYIYFAMAFSVIVELLNQRLHAKAAKNPIHLRGEVSLERGETIVP